MSAPDRFRDAATIRVEAPVERVRELLSNPGVLQKVDERLAGEEIEVRHEEDRVEVWGDDERVHLAFRLLPEGESTKVAAEEDVQPEGLLEQTKRWFFPGKAHEDLEDELDRFRLLAEAFETQHSA